MSVRTWMVGLLMVLGTAGTTWAQDPARVTPAADPGWKVEIAPIYLWLPLSISNVTLPPFPDLPKPPGGGDRPSGQTDTSLNGAAMAAFRVEKSRWMARGNFVWAGLSGERQSPNIKVTGNVIYGEAMTGVELVNHLWVEGGVRRVAVDVSAQILDYPEVSRKPGVWDPIVGLTYRAPLGRRWLLTIHGDGGGFGVGSDLDVNGSLVLDWRAANHFALSLGYAGTYFRLKDTLLDSTRLERTLELAATFHGPIMGFKLLF